MMREYLVYTSAGRAANVKRWYSSAHRNYDIWITNYTNTTALNREYADYYNERRGSKFQNLKAIFDEHQERLRSYKAIMVADDDIIISPASLAALFTLLTDNDLWILQPAFSLFGKISHRITRRKLTTTLRYTNFVEVTCPIFRTDKLFDFLSIYRPELSTCYGIDWWFLNHLGTDRMDKIAISDTYYCINPLDRFKPGGRREIDLLNTHEERISMWLAIQRETGIGIFDHREFRQIPKGLIELVFSAPGFAIEKMFNKTVTGIRKCLHP